MHIPTLAISTISLRRLSQTISRWKCSLLTTTFLVGAAAPIGATQQVEIYSLSLQIQSAATVRAAVPTRLEFTSFFQTLPPNGELPLAGGENPYTHAGYILLSSPVPMGTNYYPISLSIPMDDLDGNGMFDVLEQEPVAAVRTTGVYTDSNQMTHVVRATWRKPAGSHAGTVALELPDLGLTFTNAFENLHYSGTYEATKTGATLSGPVNLVRNGSATKTLEGALELEILTPALLEWGLGEWRTETSAHIQFEGLDLDRNAPMEYSAFYLAADGDLATEEPDYQTWLLVLPNVPDANTNGIPDLIEDPIIPGVIRLALELNGTAMSLRVTGAAGRTYDLERRSSLANTTTWIKVSSHTFATNSELIPLGQATGLNSFWRLRQ